MTAPFAVQNYNLDATLDSGQAFRWWRSGASWEGIIHGRWVRLRALPDALEAETVEDPGTWDWLTHYLGLTENLEEILTTFPADEPLRAAVQACPGLRLLRQDPWECLASFILSSTKQIIQIRQCVALLSRDFGSPIPGPDPTQPLHAFPTALQLADVPESALRSCKLGFRAKYLSAAARAIAGGDLDLDQLTKLTTAVARERLTQLPGVGPKIANCVLLFAYGRQDAFPVDVWVLRALEELYFPRRRPNPQTLIRFTETHFGPNAGYAQQYLFHYVRTQRPRPTRIGSGD
ncbi:MAG: DNA-3-methyladenine glycosylase 2 family protein [Verrucomicrobia bacterium]|nr:DNA-3-methyladenine glycosylase 2 family protein [Verrucomicrobiota bacterium]